MTGSGRDEAGVAVMLLHTDRKLRRAYKLRSRCPGGRAGGPEVPDTASAARSSDAPVRIGSDQRGTKVDRSSRALQAAAPFAQAQPKGMADGGYSGHYRDAGWIQHRRV